MQRVRDTPSPVPSPGLISVRENSRCFHELESPDREGERHSLEGSGTGHGPGTLAYW